MTQFHFQNCTIRLLVHVKNPSSTPNLPPFLITVDELARVSSVQENIASAFEAMFPCMPSFRIAWIEDSNGHAVDPSAIVDLAIMRADERAAEDLQQVQTTHVFYNFFSNNVCSAVCKNRKKAHPRGVQQPRRLPQTLPSSSLLLLLLASDQEHLLCAQMILL
jgi:hypothetical protein